MSLQALKALTQSSKATVLIAVLVLLSVGHAYHQIPTKEFVEAVMVLVSVWLGARAYEMKGQLPPDVDMNASKDKKEQRQDGQADDHPT